MAAGESQSKGSVLLVDDDPLVRRVAERMLGVLGYEVTAADGGAEALKMFGDGPANYDLVILDLSMPGMRGEEVWRRMREIHPGVKAVFASGFAESEILSELERGEVGFLHKPYRIGDLKARIEETLVGEEIRGD